MLPAVANVGISMSGGSLLAYLLVSSAANYLLQQNVLKDDTTFSTVSGGSLGYAAFTSATLTYPDLADAPYANESMLSNWQGPSNEYAFDLPAQALDPSGIIACINDLTEDIDGEPSAECQAYAGSSSVLPCLRDSLTLKSQRPVWYCAVQYLTESVGVSWEDMKTGRRPWHIQYTVMDKANVPFSTAGKPQPIAGLLKNKISATAMLVQEGVDAKFKDSPNFHSNGKRGNMLPLEITPQDAVTYSSSFLTMDTMYKGIDDERCSITGQPLIDRLLEANYAVSGHRSSTAFSHGLATDGGSADLMGLVPLLREKKTAILAFFADPKPAQNSTLPNLFGHNASNNADAPYNCHKSASRLIGTTAQVFPSSLWAETNEHMQALDNTGVMFLHNVDVLANDALGVEAYTIDTLMIVDNGRKTAFEETVLQGTDIASLEQQGYPLGAIKAAFNVPKPVGVAISLLVQWKLEQNLDAIKAAFNA